LLWDKTESGVTNKKNYLFILKRKNDIEIEWRKTNRGYDVVDVKNKFVKIEKIGFLVRIWLKLY
jgi:hypothetical protein